MARVMPLLIAAAVAAAGGSAWKLRTDARHEASREARALVERAWTTGAQVPLRGLQTIQMAGGASPQPVRVQAQVLTSREGAMRIRYISPPLAGVTIWENGTHTYRYNPRHKRLTVAERRESSEERARERIQILESYDIRLVRREPVADHLTDLVELRPKRGTGHWRRLWIDPSNGVILRDERLTGHNAVERSTLFTQVTYLSGGEEPAPGEFEPPAVLVKSYGTARPGDTSSRFKPETLTRLLGFPVRVPGWLPRGYALRGAYQTPCSADPHHQAARLEFSDGLSTITLFECGRAGDGHGRCFADDGDSRLSARYDTPDHSYLAIGDVPQSDLQRLVKSISP